MFFFFEFFFSPASFSFFVCVLKLNGQMFYTGSVRVFIVCKFQSIWEHVCVCVVLCHITRALFNVVCKKIYAKSVIPNAVCVSVCDINYSKKKIIIITKRPKMVRSELQTRIHVRERDQEQWFGYFFSNVFFLFSRCAWCDVIYVWVCGYLLLCFLTIVWMSQKKKSYCWLGWGGSLACVLHV